MRKKITLTETLELLNKDREKEKISVDDILKQLSSRGFGALLVGQSLLILLPTGAIPGFPALMALLIIISSLHFFLGKERIWLPKKIRDYKITAAKLDRVVKKAKPFTERIDKVIKPRFSFMFSKATEALIPLLAILLALTIPVLGFIPFLADVPALGILLLGLCLCGNDGLLFILSVIFFFISGSILPYTISTVFY